MTRHPEQGRPASDHRDLNADMSVFATDPMIGAGLPLWLPAGAVIRQDLEQLAREIARHDGGLPVYSPVLGKRALYERSGHWDKFSEDMFPPVRLGGDQLVLRPANCPHHSMIYAAEPRSYRQLPIRLNEQASMFRAERSGVVSGLSRVRQISLDDTHVFCRSDQTTAEVAAALRSALGAQGLLGLPVDSVRLSRRDTGDGYLGSAAQWQDAEHALRSAAAEVLGADDPPLVEAVGEAAFYGPKLDLQVRDQRGHEETIATVQLDFNQPERFDLGYDAADGTRQRVVMIHRGTLGAMERIVAALLERYSGRLPLWLAPVQVCVLPVGSAQDDHAHAVVDDLRAAGLRARLDTDGSLGARIRASRRRRDNVIAVTGPAEAGADLVHVTDPTTDFSGPVARATFVATVRGAHASRSRRIAWPALDGDHHPAGRP